MAGRSGKLRSGLSTMQDLPERSQLELGLYMTLGAAWQIRKGHAAPEVEQAHRWAWELCQQVGDTPTHVAVLTGLRRLYMSRGELHTAYRFGQQLFNLAQSAQEPYILQETYHSLGKTLYLATEHGFSEWRAIAMIVRGQALIEQGHVEAGITQTHQGAIDSQVIGSSLIRPASLVILAQASDCEAHVGRTRRVVPHRVQVNRRHC